MYHLDKWDQYKSFTKKKDIERFKGLSNTYESIIKYLCLVQFDDDIVNIEIDIIELNEEGKISNGISNI